MKWQDLPWYDKVGEVIAAAAVFALPFILLLIAEACYGPL